MIANKKIFLIAVVLATTLSLAAQSERKFLKYLHVAEAYYDVGEYSNALNYYLKAHKRKKDDAIKLKIALCQIEIRNYESASKWFKKIESTAIQKQACLPHAQSVKHLGNYSLSKHIIQKHYPDTSSTPYNYRAFLASCDSALKWQYKISEYEIKNLWKINSSGSEVSPVFRNEKLYFSTSRETVLFKSTNGYTSEPFYNIYSSSYNERKEKWKKPAFFSIGINSKDNEVGIAFSSNSTDLYFTRSTHGEYLKKFDDNKNHLKLYLCHKKILGWSSPEYFVLNDSSYSFGQPTLGQDDKVFIFVSDMPGGYGGTDLYLCFKRDSSWTTPINLGPNINTPGNELYPHLDEEGTLFFSSNFHPGFGGYDIFKTNLVKGSWTIPENLMLPINSSYDDFSFSTSEDHDKAFFSSNRKGGKGKEDLYQAILK